MSLALKEAIKIAENQLKNAGVPDAAYDARELYCFQAGLDKLGLMMAWQDVLQDNQVDAYFDLVAKRVSRVPLQHITGEQEFMGLKFKVGPEVLIPRMDTEVVVTEALTYAKGDILDLCTGSGAIAIAISKAKNIKVTASDYSKQALKLAEENARTNKAKVKFVWSDMLKDLKGAFGAKKYDLIVSNPPYIPTEVMNTLEPEVKDHDPKMALDGGNDGLDFYRIIASDSPTHLKKDGVLVLEIGYDQGKSVPKLLEETGKFKDIEVKKDLGGNDRVVIAHVLI